MKTTPKRKTPAGEKTTPRKRTTPTRSRGPLRSMRVSDGFREFVLDQLSGISDLRARAMFGGVGLYAGDAFFGILASDVLYLKVDDTNRHEFERAGASPFKPYADRPMTMSYYGVPIGVLEDAERLGGWAARAVAVAVRSKTTTRAQRSSAKRSARSGVLPWRRS